MPRVAVKDAKKGKGKGGGGRTMACDMLSFAAAREIVQKLKLKCQREWQAWSKSGQRPSNIPATPWRVYRDDGWISMPDWLGYKSLLEGKGHMLPFETARAIVRKLKLTGIETWKAWCSSGQRPFNVPCNPSSKYRNEGWISMPDWLGYGSERGVSSSKSSANSSSSSSSSSSSVTQKKTTKAKKVKKKTKAVAWQNPPPPPLQGNTYGVSSQKKTMKKSAMLPFAVARAIVRKLKLGSQKEWQAWSKAGQRPSNIPAGPSETYSDDGWISMPDWLGYDSSRSRARIKNKRQGSSSSSSSVTQKKAPPPPPPPPQGSANEVSSRKRARAASDSASDSADDTLGGSSGPPQTKIKVEVEEIGGFSIMSSESDLKHTACGLLQHGAPTS